MHDKLRYPPAPMERRIMSQTGIVPGHTDQQPSPFLLSVNNIEVIYNHVILVLKGVSLDVPEGSIVALLGGNGAARAPR